MIEYYQQLEFRHEEETLFRGTIKPRGQSVSLQVDAKMTLSEQGAAILNAMSEGSICPDDAKSLITALTGQARIIELTQLEQRIRKLEDHHEGT